MKTRVLACILIVSSLASACGGDGISAESCEDIVGETIALFQRVIDEVDASYADMNVSDVLASGSLPPLDRFRADAEQIDDLAAELGCTEQEIRPAVAGRLGELEADSELGRFLVDAFRVGGL